jgi:hypothetical protein
VTKGQKIDADNRKVDDWQGSARHGWRSIIGGKTHQRHQRKTRLLRQGSNIHSWKSQSRAQTQEKQHATKTKNR